MEAAELTIQTSAVILQTAREMLIEGLDQDTATEELAAMYEQYNLSYAWFRNVVSSSVAILSYEKVTQV
jgi:hypothetical protein